MSCLFLFGASLATADEPTDWFSSTISAGGGVSIYDGIDGVASFDGTLYVALNHFTNGFNFFTLSPGGFSKEVIDSDSGNLGSTFLAMDSAQNPHVIYGFSGWNTQIFYSHRSGSGWTKELISQGLNPSLDVDNQGVAYIVFLSTDSKNLVYAQKSGGTWNQQILVSKPGNLGGTSIAVTSENVPYIAYNYNWQVSVIKKSDPFWVEVASYTGQSPMIRFDSIDRLHLVFHSTSAVAPVHRTNYVRLTNEIPDLVNQIPVQTAIAPYLSLTTDDEAYVTADSTGIGMESGNGIYYPSALQGPKWIVCGGAPYVLSLPSLQNGDVIHANLPSRLSPPHVSVESTNRLRWTWTPPDSRAIGGFRFRRDSDETDVSGILSVTSTWVQDGLTPNQVQNLRLEVLYPGFAVASTVSVAACTLAAEPTHPSVNRPFQSALSLAWLPNGNPPGTVYRARIYVPGNPSPLLEETSDQTLQIPFSNPSLPSGVSLSAVNVDGFETFSSSVTRVARQEDEYALSFDLGGERSVDVFLPAGAAAPQPAVLAVGESVFPAVDSGTGVTGTGIGFSLPTLTPLPSGQSGRIAFHFPEGGLGANQGKPLVLGRYDDDRGQWVILPSVRTTEGITAGISKFGTFQVLTRKSLPSDVNEVRVFPNPFRLSEGLTIQNVPAGTRVRVRTSAGRLVREIEGAAGGDVFWDGNETSGKPAHSGVYVVEVDGAGQQKRVKVIANR